MENVVEILESINDFSIFAQTRALEILKAKGYRKPVRLNKIEFKETEIRLTFKEDTGYDCPEYEYINLSIPQLKMSDEDWDIYIKDVTYKRVTREANNLKTSNDLKRAAKEMLYGKLKNELGH